MGVAVLSGKPDHLASPSVERRLRWHLNASSRSAASGTCGPSKLEGYDWAAQVHHFRLGVSVVALFHVLFGLQKETYSPSGFKSQLPLQTTKAVAGKVVVGGGVSTISTERAVDSNVGPMIPTAHSM